MIIYGTALLAICHLLGDYFGNMLGILLGVKANVGGVAIAMILLIASKEVLARKGYLPKVTQFGVLYWSIVGTVNSAPINHEIALHIAAEVLEIIALNDQTPVIFIVDTQGQALSRADEVLCLNRSFAHLASCVDLLRRQRHPNLAIILGEAVSGGFLSYGLMANQVFALESSQVKVMDLNAMSRVTKIPVERLKELSQSSAIFAPGVENFYKMGAISEIWHDLNPDLVGQAIQQQQSQIDSYLNDERREIAQQRQGRHLSHEIVAAVLRA